MRSMRRPAMAMDVCLWLATHPGRVLFTTEISKRYDMGQADTWQSLNPYVTNGWLLRTKSNGTRENHYAAGPNLEAAQGRWE